MRTAAEAARAVAAREVSPIELAREALDAAERWQPVTNAFSLLRPEDALAEASARADDVVSGEPLGPLHGVPVAVKDLFDVAGWETTGCSRAYAGRVAARDSEAVRRLRLAGAVVIGKTNQHELAAGATSVVSACGAVRNPWDSTRISGGSSGGSAAAVAARVVPLALGTDTGGSVRIPAALCGVTGLKPTWGAVPLDGVMPLAPSLDVAGPLATTATDAAIAFAVIAEADAAFLADATGPVAGLRVAPLDLHETPVRDDVRVACDHVVEVLGDAGAAVAARAGSIGYEPRLWDGIGWPEFAAAHGDALDRGLEPPTRRFMLEGMARSPDEHDAARAEAGRLRERLLARLRDVDVLVTPVVPFPAPGLEQQLVEVGQGRSLDVGAGAVSVLTRAANLAGVPALAIPAGMSAEMLPLGVQLIGRPGEEATLLRAAIAFQERTDHHRRVPVSPGMPS